MSKQIFVSVEDFKDMLNITSLSLKRNKETKVLHAQADGVIFRAQGTLDPKLPVCLIRKEEDDETLLDSWCLINFVEKFEEVATF